MYISKHSIPWKLLLFLTAMILAISACGSKEEATVAGSNANNSASQNNAQDQNISNTTNQEAAGFEALEDTDDWLLYVEGESLYLAHFDGSDPSLVSEFVHPPTVATTPSNTHVAFTSGERRRSLSMVDLETLNIDGSLRVSSQFGFMGPWSPDGEWMVVFNFPSVYLAPTDASESYRVGAIQNVAFAQFWLQDSTLLVIETPNATNVTDVRRIDPVTGDEIEIDEATEQNLILAFNNQPDLAGAIAFQETVSTALGVDVANPIILDPDAIPFININAPPANAQGVPDRCGTFEIQDQPLELDVEATTLATVEESVFITNQARLNDGTVLFVRWYFENCDSVTMRAALMRLDPDGNLDVITDEIDPGTSPNLSFFFGETGNRISVSSDQNYVVWFGGGFSADEATLNVTRLDTLETTVLLRNERNSANASTFHLDSVLNFVSWVPR